MKTTGEIWRLSEGARRRIVLSVCRSLEDEYGRPRLGNPTEPVSDLVYIVLSNRTTPSVAQQVYNDVRRTYRNWQDLIDSEAHSLEGALRPAGLAKVKSRQLLGALKMIRQDFGSCSLEALRGEPPDSVEAYLVRLPGVSQKVAKCIMLYTLELAVLPVDIHVHRVATRLGWTKRKRADQSHEELEAIVAPAQRYAFHVDCVLHGRAICLASTPRCESCVISRDCGFPRNSSS